MCCAGFVTLVCAGGAGAATSAEAASAERESCAGSPDGSARAALNAGAVVGRGCLDLYFGYTAAPDYEAAYACFDAQRHRSTSSLAPTRDWLGRYGPMMVMRLNGQGVCVDLEEAAILLNEWQAADPARSEQRLFLKRVLLERRAGLGPVPAAALEFCGLPADAAFTVRCTEIQRRREEGGRARYVGRVREQVPEAAKPKLPGLLLALGGYAEREAERIERAKVLDDDAQEATDRQRGLVQGHFDLALRRLLIDGELESTTSVKASRRGRELERVYQQDRRERAAGFKAYERALPDSAPTYERYRRRYDDSAQRSHAAWKRYRDAWIGVVEATVDGASARAEAEASVRVLLTRQRSRELRPD